MNQFNVDKDLKIPLHHQIYLALLEKIENGQYRVNDKLPSEPELQSLFDVSRITVRSAMQELEKNGYVKKFRGIGTIVCEPKRKYNLQHLSSFSDDIKEYGEKSSSILLNFGLIVPGEKISGILNIPKDQKVYYIERSRLRDNLIVGLNKAYIKKENNLLLEESEFKPETSLYALLKKKGIYLKHAIELLEAQMPSTELCHTLNIKKNQPIFYRERITFMEQNNPMEYVEMFYRADVYQYKISLDLDKKD
ncbi:GntR family transcriptional regulator [Ruminiclostridium sufflavum DSM 19573]|uniref:GntR family transcriptional regulator n=1 Tax=Ruminiclostridium sufflavum DSM 19573 TaxID=1121337 RepID=A0A318XPA1_9FIRM|nr:GntR family transcriptional regulator [Ruminiclostridium sufflavum]PYG87932.1 GntR family transcriptional regulator [Ruminiclostridium sufflavum DSM 19573]